ncbi:hypothetical protein [Streptomyces sp. NPDC046332]|uniref:phage tail protein n=1 Tax=unclassified Streptomyces TaxID=2593676 RepID=UPI0033CADF3F
MASQAEVDLVISTAGALPDLERDLTQIIRQAENGADTVDVGVGINTSQSLAQLDAQITSVISRVEGDIDGVEVGVLVEQREAVRRLRQQVDSVVNSVNGSAVDPVSIQGVLDSAETIRTVRAQLNRVATVIEATAPDVELGVEVDRDSTRDLSRLTDGLRTFATTGLRAATTAGSLGVAVGALVPVLAGAAAAAAQIAPAAAVATSGMLAMQLASGTLKLAMVGVEEAIKAAFDPDVKPEELKKALEDLAPEARAFVLELRSMRKELRSVQQGVQQRVFRNLDEDLERLSRTALPLLRTALNSTAVTLNEMARGAAAAASELAADGTLGEALDGAAKGLENLKGLPGQIVTSLGQLAAASAPALDKLTRRIDTAATQLSEKLTKAFDSGALEDEINQAIETIGQLFRVVGDVFQGIGNIFGGLTQDGRGLFDILEDISQAFEKLTASEEFQTILGELAKTADTLVKNILPLLEEAFIQLAPVIEELAPLVREFVEEVGPELIPVLQELGPILLDIVGILRDQLPFAIEFTKAFLQTLVVVLKSVEFVLREIVAPALRLVSRILNSEYVRDIAAASRETATAIGNILQRFEAFRERVSTAVAGVLSRLGDIVNYIRVTFLSEVTGALATVVGRFTSLPGEIRGAIGSVAGLLYSVGADIIQGLIGGILSQVSRLMGIVSGIADRITSTIKGALSIASPSKVMIGIGEDTAEGLVVGLRRMIPEIESTVEGIGTSMTPSFALPGGQSLSLSPLSVGAPTVQVFIGNEQLDARTDARIQLNNRARDRVRSQGVRR